jgi:hypothetical protein
MTAFNFKLYMAPKILDGTKLSTIRSTKRCNVGDVMQLYTGMRTKSCHKIRDVVCVGVASIIISRYSLWQLGETEGNVCPSIAPLHEQEGFLNAFEMVEFFAKEYGLPYRGFLHAWRPE